MSDEKLEDQQTDYRGFVELNEAIDSINMKLLRLEQEINRYGAIYLLLVGYLDGQLNEDELERISDNILAAEPDNIAEVMKKVDNENEDKDLVHSISQLVDSLEKDRW